MRSSTALYQLKKYLELFLKNNLVKITGYSKTGVMDYQFGAYTQSQSGEGLPNESFTFDPMGIFIGDPITAKVHNIRMIDREEAFSIDRIEPCQMRSGADIMVTGQLSDCCFCIGGHNANMPVVAHIRPRAKEGLNGLSTHNALINGGKFWVFGKIQRSFGQSSLKPYHHTYTDFASIVGVRVNSQWQIFAQHVNPPQRPNPSRYPNFVMCI
ncbi:hypothetical protein MO867_10705 [Microbulbifer sp. OS29]|uniref:Uncharacterized protein n=1 Tax=Microbulbifer okhotskensis TaxID=2926617 RepID=A0A9X2ENE1_9GAMM|nr:hypothetical protein [Microbulbifer okhotskensis]MCO1334810.1 hypothetical protein [Microbulbifer okhotskensis]